MHFYFSHYYLFLGVVGGPSEQWGESALSALVSLSSVFFRGFP